MVDGTYDISSCGASERIYEKKKKMYIKDYSFYINASIHRLHYLGPRMGTLSLTLIVTLLMLDIRVSLNVPILFISIVFIIWVQESAHVTREVHAPRPPPPTPF